jgi:hypothetical protein
MQDGTFTPGAKPRRLCARAGCGARATATLRFESIERAAWLLDIDAATARSAGNLCALHADTLVLPRGWKLHDERTAQRIRAEQTRQLAPVAPDPDPLASGPIEELAEVLDARTPLLRRAFEKTMPNEQRSSG